MAVVVHHTGSPSKTTTAQKEMMAARRSHMLWCDSGGGEVCAFVVCGAIQDPSDNSDATDAPVALGGAMLRCSLDTSVKLRTEMELQRTATAVIPPSFDSRGPHHICVTIVSHATRSMSIGISSFRTILLVT
jgi:hypothetical protein